MKITPQSEEEVANKFGLLPDGTYPFTVLDSRETPSKSEKNKGRMKFDLKLNVHGPDGDRHVYDYFADWFSSWKLRHFCASTGLLSAYEAGEVDGAKGGFTGRQGYVTVETDPANGNFKAKNAVVDYVVKESSSQPTATPTEADDDVPF